MSISNCPKLEGYNGPNSIEKFKIKDCASLVSLRCSKEDHLKMGMESATKVTIVSCVKLGSYYCPNNIKKLSIRGCPLLTSLTFLDDLPFTLKSLTITGCGNMEDLTWLLNNFLSSLESLEIGGIPNLRLFSEGCLVHLTRLTINGCDNVESIPDNGYGFLPFLCLSYLNIINCKNVKSFPHELLQNLTSLKEMNIRYCPSLDFPRGSWPPNLSSLEIGGLKKPVSEWGFQKFPTSLVTLFLIGGDSDGLVSLFAAAKGEEEEEDISSSFILPSSLTTLTISNFKELESVSEGMKHLTCLQHLDIQDCPKVRDLPEILLPSLSSLWVYDCSWELKEKCSERYISQIPLCQPTPIASKAIDGHRGSHPHLLERARLKICWEDPPECTTYNGSEDHPAHNLLLDAANYSKIGSNLFFAGLAGLENEINLHMAFSRKCSLFGAENGSTSTVPATLQTVECGKLKDLPEKPLTFTGQDAVENLLERSSHNNLHTVIAAHPPQEPNLFALGLIDGTVHDI
ncbi:hypothetical protein M8C21_007467 [Ambrosia artemisiifolia]|uniref:Uncharacterized protein n=1 Tax=Ambrosia artemisiifolia TaxID=4212 RepID=A0AAD5BZJ4_AMBAR|nr:hypothetical protein M8C21_007467 [Ambrosia artemisiifolia]